MSWEAHAHVIQLTNVTRTEKLLLYALAHYHSNKRDEAWPSVPTLARDSLMSPRQAIRVLDSLEKKGVLVIERRTGRANVYRFVSNPDPTGDIAMSRVAASTSDIAMSPVTNETSDTAMSRVPVTFSKGPVTQLCHPTSDIAMSPEPTWNRHVEPTCRTDNRAQGRARSREPTEGITRNRDPDPYLEVFEEAFLRKYQVFYRSTKPDFVQLAELKKTQRGELPVGDWEQACEHYFETGLGKHTMADLCSRYAVFRKSALDRYGKPLVASISSDKTKGNTASLRAFVAIKEEKK